ncbi:MAG TPA: ABC transporter ATP-binding protein/permease [Pusillimonas sp.]|uniref:ABC transporter ATP-binding protein/permease n=1 Tax=Pusillimonas sp. TaxID=3040095 RepID=UPI002C9F5C1F|nr:ABC transporter ATP-binding protein/permease [Pusillimonas sp.]HUH88704.1 ABC transporter ATP-binding protein/permease [Pusillimonas sp.]
MNWSEQLVESGLWLAQAYVITLVVFTMAAWVLARFTVWGRQFWRLSGGYFSPKRSWRPLLTVALILFLTLCGVRLQVLFSNWYNTMYTALQDLNAAGFWFAMYLFATLATIHVVRSLVDFYIQQAFTIRWREWLNEKMLSAWLQKQSYYRTQHLDQPLENPDQRIQQDVTIFAQASLTLSMGVVDAIVSTLAFTAILWSLSGPIALLGVEIPRGMVFLVFAYVLIATVFAIRIGRPLISLNFLNERFNADYRYALVRLREYAESIAFYAGEKVEGLQLRGRFNHVINNAWAIVYRSLKFLGFNFTVSQAAVVFPLIIQAQRFFSQQISLGDLMQTTQAFGRLQDNLSFFRNAYDEFASYRATLERLIGFSDAMEAAAHLPAPDLRENVKALVIEDLTVRRPDGKVLINGLNLRAQAGDSLLIRGPSGAGKTTLLRAVAGLWPYSEGIIARPGDSVLFLSQKPYIPLGSLRSALYYPQEAPIDLAGQEAQRVLAAVQLAHLVDRLDEVGDWTRILSLGEQQRLAFGRLVLARPALAFLDEATSAMDEGLEDAMYRLAKAELPETILISVGHRGTLLAHHSRTLNLSGDGGWEVLVR